MSTTEVPHAPTETIEPAPSSLAPVSVIAPVPGVQRSRKLGTAFWVAVGWLSVVVFLAVFGRMLPFVHPKPDLLGRALIPEDASWIKTFSWKHPFGMDTSGNDWLSLLIISARNSIIIAFATIVFGFIVGGMLGMLAGYRRRMFDSIASFIITVLLSVPPLLFIILLISVLSASSADGEVVQGLQTSVIKLSLALGILSVPITFRVVRGATISFAGREFVLAARAMGAKTWRVLFREILPNVAKPMLAYGLVSAGSVMVIEGALSYLGVGVGNTWAWGKMIQSGASLHELRVSPHVVIEPAIVLFLTVLSFNFVGDKIRERLEVKDGNL